MTTPLFPSPHGIEAAWVWYSTLLALLMPLLLALGQIDAMLWFSVQKFVNMSADLCKPALFRARTVPAKREVSLGGGEGGMKQGWVPQCW